jgi:hypothetical protein
LVDLADLNFLLDDLLRKLLVLLHPILFFLELLSKQFDSVAHRLHVLPLLLHLVLLASQGDLGVYLELLTHLIFNLLMPPPIISNSSTILNATATFLSAYI